MVDRAAREQLASILRSYMSEEITGFQLDERLDSFRRFRNGKAVELIAADLWGCYDDLRDHKVVASKQTWDYFNRHCSCSHRMRTWKRNGVNFSGTPVKSPLESAYIAERRCTGEPVEPSSDPFYLTSIAESIECAGMNPESQCLRGAQCAAMLYE